MYVVVFDVYVVVFDVYVVVLMLLLCRYTHCFDSITTCSPLSLNLLHLYT